MTNLVLYTISGIDGVFADAFLTDEDNNLLFLSIWGRDTAVQEFLARMTIPDHEQGIKDFKINNGRADRYIKVPSPSKLDKHGFRQENNIHRELSQVWIFDKCAMKPDLANRQVHQLYKNGKCPDPWPLIQSVCPTPLLDEWREPIMKEFSWRGWCQFLPEECGDGLRSFRIDLSDPNVEAVVTEMVENGTLTLSTSDSNNIRVA